MNPTHEFASAPRYSNPIACDNGEWLVYTSNKYLIASGRDEIEARVLKIRHGHSYRLPIQKTSRNFRWIPQTQDVIWQESSEDGIEIWISPRSGHWSTRYSAGRVSISEGDASIVAFAQLEDEDIGFLLFQERQTNDTRLQLPPSSATVFDALPVRSFSRGFARIDHRLFFHRIQKRRVAGDGDAVVQYAVASGNPIDVLADTDLVFIPYPGGTSMEIPSCDIGLTYIAVSARTRSSVELAVWTSCIYCIPIPADSQSQSHELKRISTPSCTGFVSRPSFSSNGRSLSFLREENARFLYLSHRSVFVVADPESDTQAQEVKLTSPDGSQSPLYPSTVSISSDGQRLYFLAVDDAQQVLYEAHIESGVIVRLSPEPGQRGSVQSLRMCLDKHGNDCCLVSVSSLTKPTSFALYDTNTQDIYAIKDLSDASSDIPNLSKSQVSWEYFESADRIKMQTFVIKPSNFDDKLKYPVALFVHGGPVYAWTDSWPFMWHPGIFAENGIIVIMPNITGSMGYSRDFRDKVWGDLGGRPYQDLQYLMDHLRDNVPYADVSRAVALGGSYGGYMMNWMAGQALGKRFKALVNHAGIFHASELYSSDIPDVWKVAFAGPDADPADVKAVFDKWDPSRLAQQWTVPMLFTHGDLDGRCPISMSLAAFAVCQQRKIPSRLFVYHGESHGFTQMRNCVHWYEAMVQFLGEYIQFGPCE